MDRFNKHRDRDEGESRSSEGWTGAIPYGKPRRPQAGDSDANAALYAHGPGDRSISMPPPDDEETEGILSLISTKTRGYVPPAMPENFDVEKVANIYVQPPEWTPETRYILLPDCKPTENMLHHPELRYTIANFEAETHGLCLAALVQRAAGVGSPTPWRLRNENKLLRVYSIGLTGTMAINIAPFGFMRVFHLMWRTYAIVIVRVPDNKQHTLEECMDHGIIVGYHYVEVTEEEAKKYGCT